MNEDLILNLERAFRGKGWHGPTLLGSVRGVSPVEAAIVPARLKHSIWNLVLHAAYWKYAACLRIAKAGIRGLPTEFPRSPSNFPALPKTPSAAAWREDVQLLKSQHEHLICAVGQLTGKQLNSIPPGGRSRKLREIIVGVAAHDAYHTGQIQLIKRLIRHG
jgi:hypothetical protein